MNHLGLFEGIGGFSLAARWMGWNTVAWCEINPFGQNVLSTNFPNAIGHGDITTTDFSIYKGRIDVLTGGFPCQDASGAKTHGGGQMGLQGERTGLYWHMVRAIEEIRPRFVIAENVPGILTTNGGEDFAKILKSLYEIGYNAEWRCLYASDFGAMHQRERCYIVAYPLHAELQMREPILASLGKKIPSRSRNATRTATQNGLSWNDERPFPTLADGVSHKLDGSRYWYDETIKAAGNAVVPIIPYHIFKAIESTYI